MFRIVYNCITVTSQRPIGFGTVPKPIGLWEVTVIQLLYQVQLDNYILFET